MRLVLNPKTPQSPKSPKPLNPTASSCGLDVGITLKLSQSLFTFKVPETLSHNFHGLLTLNLNRRARRKSNSSMSADDCRDVPCVQLDLEIKVYGMWAAGVGV